jgi:hypothetical protein
VNHVVLGGYVHPNLLVACRLVHQELLCLRNSLYNPRCLRTLRFTERAEGAGFVVAALDLTFGGCLSFG